MVGWLDIELPSLCILGALEELDDLPGGHESVFFFGVALSEFSLCPCLNFLGRCVIATLDQHALVLKQVKIILLQCNVWLFSLFTNLNELESLELFCFHVRLYIDFGHLTFGGEVHTWMKDGLEVVIANPVE